MQARDRPPGPELPAEGGRLRLHRDHGMSSDGGHRVAMWAGDKPLGRAWLRSASPASGHLWNAPEPDCEDSPLLAGQSQPRKSAVRPRGAVVSCPAVW